MRRRCANVLEVYLAAEWGCGWLWLWIGSGMRSWRGNRWDVQRERVREKLSLWQHFNAISVRVGCCLSVVVEAYYLEQTRRAEAQAGRVGAGQGISVWQLWSDPFSISRRDRAQGRWLPRRSFNKVCRRLGIKISCELTLIFYLFVYVFALWLSVFSLDFSRLHAPSLFLPFIRTRFCCRLLLINSKSFSTRMRAVSVG